MIPHSVAQPGLDAIRAAALRIDGFAVRTPTLAFDTGSDATSVHLKLENLQPVGSFKIRGAASAMRVASPSAMAQGVYTASAGNMAQGVAWCARRAGVPCTVVVPEHAPETKVAAVERMGARAIRVPYDDWWQAMVRHEHPGIRGLFIHPFADNAVVAGNATIGLEIAEDLHGVDAVLVPWGGGGLACGIAAALAVLSPRTRVHPVEIAGAAPLSASLQAGKPVAITPKRSFIDGMGGKSVFPEMWSLATALLAPPIIVTVDQVAAAVKTLATRSRIIAEGAGAAPLAAALNAPPDGARRVVCIVSGGNIDLNVLTGLLTETRLG